MLRLTPKQYAERQGKLAKSAKKWKALCKPRSKGEEALEMALHAVRAPAWLCEYRFDLKRRWRADFAFLKENLLVEVEGGSWSGGRHNRGAGFELDCEKYNSAVLQGWRVLRFTTEMVEDGRALGIIMRALA